MIISVLLKVLQNFITAKRQLRVMLKKCKGKGLKNETLNCKLGHIEMRKP